MRVPRRQCESANAKRSPAILADPIDAASSAFGPRFEAALTGIDAANAQDPNMAFVRGETGPKELLHGRLVSGWVQTLRPDASEALLLAARAHHIRRWTLPRTSYAPGRRPYLQWRARLHEIHAKEAAAILRSCGYDAETTARVQAIVRKQRLRTDPEVQALEDALALAFLETQLDETIEKVADDQKIVDILQKTWVKMTPAGQQAALSLPLSPRGLALVQRALGG